jgi:hypothetical protein
MKKTISISYIFPEKKKVQTNSFYAMKSLAFQQLSQNLYYNILILSVCSAIDSAPGYHRYHTNMRPVSLNPVWPERWTYEKNFLEKWPVAEIPKKEFSPLMLFNGKILLYIFAVLFERTHC